MRPRGRRYSGCFASARVHTGSIEEAGPRFDALIDEELAGKAVVIARAAGPGVRLVREDPADAPAPKRPARGAMRGRIGSMAGRIAIYDDEATRPLPDEWLGLDLWTDKPLCESCSTPTRSCKWCPGTRCRTASASTGSGDISSLHIGTFLFFIRLGSAPESDMRELQECAWEDGRPLRGQAARRGARSVAVNRSESPLDWLAARGLVSARQVEAGERLRGDYERAQLGPRVTMAWDRVRVDGGGAAPDLAPPQLAAKRRFDAATAALGTGLSDIAWRTICAGERLPTAEAALGWPARAGRVVLGLALDRLADHYGLH